MIPHSLLRLARTSPPQQCFGQPEQTVGDRSPIHDVVLDLAGVTSGTARRVTRTVRIVVRRVR